MSKAAVTRRKAARMAGGAEFSAADVESKLLTSFEDPAQDGCMQSEFEICL